MYEFTVEYKITGNYCIHVAANNEAEAQEKAGEIFAKSFCVSDLEDLDIDVAGVY